MKYRFLLLTALACGHVAAQQAAQPASTHASDLRQAVRQYHPAVAAPPPRQLSAGERAELRKQLADFNHPRPNPNDEAPLEPLPRILQR